MKELTIEQKAQRYDEAIEKTRIAYKDEDRHLKAALERIFPELKESEDERMRNFISNELACLRATYEKDTVRYNELTEAIAWLKKQGEQILANSAKTCKNEQNPADNVEPKFKVKYAGGEYNVLEVKDIAGVTFYGIEDEPNHIDYVQSENCERVGGYSIKEDMSPFPTQPAKFSKQKPAWREKDEIALCDALWCCKQAASIAKDENDMGKIWYAERWLKSLKERMKGERYGN